MQITARLVQVMPVQTGEGKNGTWKKQDIIVETDGQFPKKICVTVWGDKIDERYLKPGNQLNISFDIESREYNGRWYTDVKAWKIEPVPTSGSNEEAIPPHGEPDAPPDTDSGDLPF